MISERDFVLNNINKYESVFSKEELNVHLKYAKDLYKTICENTSEEKDDYWFGNTTRIKFSSIKKIEYISDFINVYFDDEAQSFFNEDMIKFKQWFERKRG